MAGIFPSCIRIYSTEEIIAWRDHLIATREERAENPFRELRIRRKTTDHFIAIANEELRRRGVG